MNLILQNFNNKYLEFVVPKEKENLYYEPTDQLNKFDYIELFYVFKTNRLLIIREVVQEIASPFLYKERLFYNNQLLLDAAFHAGELGIVFNQYFFDMYTKGNSDIPESFINTYLLWDSQNVQVVLYIDKDRIFLEIFGLFEFNFNASNKENEKKFKNFMSSYSPIEIMRLDENILREWYKQFKNFFELKDNAALF